ncbi:alpha/beta fold hydrolase [Apibacter muscae]|uniref:Alpha/beta fold hydrolase n=1 Tax=Apibacter muscae TaxID=2509004 RepID=A0A563DDP8_9FLAO|nr:alpha/beta fold hydrolase [Apibacter muscae]TWP23880.1 alpha/beta fold hydrolase [Apibacter muscae]TWP28316.1 alpha/beta fold hydrolase [Apibacter muscae]
MNYIKKSTYNPTENLIYTNAHLSTIVAGAIKKYPIPPYNRERLELEDGDFLLLDWWRNENTNKLIILSHGLEGHSRRTYINSCADYFHQAGYSILAWNQRSCGGEMNRLPSLYHVGMIHDLEKVVTYSITQGYSEVYLIGYSMGGAVSLNYTGRMKIPKELKACIAFSSPLDFVSNAETFRKPANYIYLKNFINDFKKKLKYKSKQYPDIFDINLIRSINSFDEFDEYVTVPLFGFKNKEDYYKKVSPIHILDNINIPTLIVNAKNDPFLSPESFLKENQMSNANIYFEMPKYGGHIGFMLPKSKFSWVEIRAKEFIEDIKVK